MRSGSLWLTLGLLSLLAWGALGEPEKKAPRQRGVARVEEARPKSFPHRIWAACDFEGKTPDYAWFGPTETKNIPKYPGNFTALGAHPRPVKNVSARKTGINPVPGPVMGKVNKLYLRYFLRGTTEAVFQHFSLSSNDNNHIRVSGLTEGRWSELTLNFSRDGRRNDGTDTPFAAGHKVDDLFFFLEPEGEKEVELFLDEVVLYDAGRP